MAPSYEDMAEVQICLLSMLLWRHLLLKKAWGKHKRIIKDKMIFKDLSNQQWKKSSFLLFLNVYFMQLHKIPLAKGGVFLWLCYQIRLLTLHSFAVRDLDLFFCFSLSKKLNNGLLLLFSYYRDTKKKLNWLLFMPIFKNMSSDHFLGLSIFSLHKQSIWPSV